MKCFISGITGFIGSNLARQLSREGHTVNAIIRGEVSGDRIDLPGLQLFRAGLHDLDALKTAMYGCDVAYHLAAYARPWAKDPSEYYRINVEGAVNVFTAALETGVKKVVFTSSAATMSPSAESAPVTENTPREMPYFNAYETSKAEAEAKAAEFCARGLPVVTVNPSRVYGPGPLNPSNSVTKMIAGYLEGTWRIIPGDGKKIGNYVFIDDVVQGHMLAAQKGRGGERYILGGDNVTFERFFAILGEMTGHHRKMIRLPLPVMIAAARFLEWQGPLTGIPPAITSGFVKKYMNHWMLSSEKAINELGYRITPIETGVRKTMEWLEGR